MILARLKQWAVAGLLAVCKLAPGWLIKCCRQLDTAYRLQRSVFFATGTYRDNCPDIGSYRVFPALHYVRYGARENRTVHPLFDPDHYLAQMPAASGRTPDALTDYLLRGWRRGLDPHPFFDTRYYLSQVRETIAEDVNPLVHYLETGWRRGLAPHPFFQPHVYLDHLSAPLPEDTCPLVHFVTSETRAAAWDPEGPGCDTDRKITGRIDSFSFFNATVFVKGTVGTQEGTICEISYLNRSGNLSGPCRVDLWQPEADRRPNQWRFELTLTDDLPENPLDLVLLFRFQDGSVARQTRLWADGLRRRPHQTFLTDVFIPLLAADNRPARVLEIGARDRSGYVSRDHIVPAHMHHVGIDILPGNGVDVVCDAHALSRVFPENYFHYVYSLNVFEHIFMPWKAVVEINRVLKPGGLVMIFSHQAFPLHDTPWDFWRFSDTGWQALFNAATGFKIRRSLLGDPVHIVAGHLHPGNRGIENMPAYIHAVVLAEKIAETDLDWPVDVSGLIPECYPE